MLKTKDGYAKVIGTSYQGSSDYLLLSNGGQLGVNTLVRAGSYEKGDLNNLDTYSFIKSVMSSNKDTSPKGSIGWYNVIQAVHRNGSGDGPSYIGQIALGMTTNTNDMFFRGKRTDPWKTVIHSGNYTEFINNYYWANVKISTSSSTTTSPTVHTLTATRVCAGHDPEIDNSISCSNWFRSSGNTGWYNTTYEGGWYMSDTSWIRAHNDVGIYTGGQIYSSNSIRMGDIYLQNTNEINNDNSDLYLNYRNTNNISICHGGGSVIIGPIPDNVDNNKLYVNGPTTINGSTTLNNIATFNGLVTNNGGILPASYDVNKNNIACYVWGDAMSTGVTAITDALNPKYVGVTYSQNNGTSWVNYTLSDNQKFALYANNGNSAEVYLGNRNWEGINLTPVQINQLMITFEIPNSLYSQLCWASVDIGNGVQTICTVEIIAKDGAIKNTFTKSMYGWNQFNYINFWGINNPTVNIGWDGARFVRFKFKHDPNNTQVRNAQIRKIRLFSFTKYTLDNNDFRSVMAYTGHLYKYDNDLNITFPNALQVGNNLILTSTNKDYYGTKDANGGVINTKDNCYLRIGKNNSELMLTTNSTKGNAHPAFYIKDQISTNRLFKCNSGFAINPIHLRDLSYYDDDIIIENKAYKAFYVGTQGTSVGKSFILADNTYDQNQVIVIRQGVDGEICFIKDAGDGLFRYYLQDTYLMRSGNQGIISTGTFSLGFDDGKARFIIYSADNNIWYEFYCG